MEETRNDYKILVGKSDGKMLVLLGRPRWIILKWVLKKQGVWMRTTLILLRIRSSGGLL
jgi:hypothetical protein